MSNRRIENTQETNIGRQMLNTYLPYWPLFLALLVVAFVGARIYLNYVTPVYEATARILIKDEKKGTDGAKATETFDVLSSKKIIENEIEVIRSKELIAQVVKKLKLYAPVYEEHSLRDASAYITSPVNVEARDMNAISEAKKVHFTFDNSKQTVAIANQTYPVNKWVETSYGTLRFNLNKNYTPSDNATFFFSLVNPKSAIAAVDGKLAAAATNKNSSIIKLSFRDEVPQRGEQVLNELLFAYNNAMADDKNTLAVNTLSFLDKRLEKVESELDTVEKKIQKYKAGRGAIDIGTEGRLFLENVSSNDQKMSEIGMQLAVLDQVETYVRAKDMGSSIVPSTLGVSDPVLSQLVNKLYQSELEYESLRKTTAENNPVLVSITDQIQKMKPGIMENIQNQRRSLMASRSNLSATNSTYNSMLQSIPEKERMLIDINREQGIKSELYTFLLQKREEAALSHASATSDTRIIDKADTADTPVSPNKKVIYLSALLIALFSGIGFVYARENFSNKIMFRQQIESLTASPILAEIPYEKSSELIVTNESKRTFTAEQFRRLRITLNQIGVSNLRKRMLVTSSISGEGKSFVAANLAMTLALTGKKVVLLDFDLNNPSLSRLNVQADAGITEYLQGTAAVEDIIVQTNLHENLSMIMPGKLPSNPTELIMNGKTAELLDYLDAMFDYIVIDTAPVVPVTDAYLLTKYCDVTLYVIRHGYTPSTFIERIDANNKIHPLNNVVLVFNGVTARGFGNKNYGYGYGYGYIHRDSKRRTQLPVAR